ncbi:heterokaryon incompatibility protein-domain-containing protein [Chaetomidium leptoderma]|uniref:Heterokaryon incompatibility protein-domain-containing protein n=1 Tax=Chaetomidium leptoderma TaxID=669021 RepID=A0AAN6VPB9_9PEZI|nr:heterokaryon incompatibility protein-domain-containing protein [Chaetomidium leptoderma]
MDQHSQEGPDTLLESGHIRLLRLMPHKRKDAGIQCQLFNYPLHDSGDGTTLYEALSYVWGDAGGRPRISIGQRDVEVTPNLHAALLHLRDTVLERVLWVDAICINQSDPIEKGQQIQFMAKIYAKAGRVIVWLGEAADGSDQAIEDIRFAAVLALLQRPWFQRIWQTLLTQPVQVLQEVAAARNVLIKCDGMEIDGYAFYTGLSALNLSYEGYPNLRSRIYTTTYLIRGALFRPRRVTSQPGPFSLQIRPLSELVDMYHTRKATERHDKVYALLGMRSDDDGETKFPANYKTPWGQAFQQLINSFLSDQVSVDSWDDEEIAVIRSKGCVLGKVSSVERDATWEDRQDVVITWQLESSYRYAKDERSDVWNLQTGAKSVHVGDVICLLQGALRPTIIRLHDGDWVIIKVAVHPTDKPRATVRNGKRSEFPSSISTPLHDFFLVWDWADRPQVGGYENHFIRNQVPKRSELGGHLHKAARLRSAWLISQHMETYGVSVGTFQRITRVFDSALKSMGSPGSTRPGGGSSEERGTREIGVMFDQLVRDHGKWTVICVAAAGGQRAVVELLLNTDEVDSNAEDYLLASLWLAEQNGHGAVRKLLLKAGRIDSDAKDTDGQAVLLQAARNGLDPNFEDMDGLRPVQVAVDNDHAATVKVLLENDAGFDLDSINNDGLTIFARAALYGRESVMKLLLEAAGANLELPIPKVIHH